LEKIGDRKGIQDSSGAFSLTLTLSRWEREQHRATQKVQGSPGYADWRPIVLPLPLMEREGVRVKRPSIRGGSRGNQAAMHRLKGGMALGYLTFRQSPANRVVLLASGRGRSPNEGEGSSAISLFERVVKAIDGDR
jgi:hypothetical protein